MWLIYTFEEIQQFSIFSGYDLLSFTDFQKICLILGVNIFSIIFYFFLFYLIYKVCVFVINRMF